MKILAIRGANLASLEGEFEVVLDRGPLAEEGVFAICGPTGAGKSTLLDAMCLALYETAPRLEGQGRVRVGREGDERQRITSSDPRSILRKGTGHGFAEVDFEGVDTLRYRARWDVRRSRNRPGGKLQAATMSLTALDLTALDADEPEHWAGRKTDVKEEIERRLGLSFDQFKRSVLLAQGDFAAFLDADAKERADLLERMTGTAIYGAISVEAHARASRERERMDRHFAQLQDVPLLAPEERAQHQERAAELAVDVGRDELAKANAEAAVRWHYELAALRSEERLAAEQKVAVEKQLEVWEPKRPELEAAESVRSLRGLFSVVADAQTAHEKRTAEHLAARDAASLAEAAARVAADARTRADEALEAARSDAETTAVTVRRARELDREVDVHAKAADLARVVADDAAAECADASARQAALEARAETIRLSLAAHDRWLRERSPIEPLAREWSGVRVQLERWAKLHADESVAMHEWGRAKVEITRASLREAESASRLSALELQRSGHERETASLRAKLTALPTEALGHPARWWSARLATIETLVRTADEATDAHERELGHRERSCRAREEATAADKRAEAQQRQTELVATRRDEATRQRDLVRAQLDLASHRAELVDGEPCPLCGSEDHPLASENPALDAILADVDERLRGLRDELRLAEAVSASALEDAASQRALANAADEQAADRSAALAAASARYRETASELEGDAAWPDELAPLLPKAAREALDVARREAEETLAALTSSLEARRSIERETDVIRARLETATHAVDAARTAREAATRALAEAVHAENAASIEHARIERERVTLEAELDPQMAPFHAWAGVAVSVRSSESATLRLDAGANGGGSVAPSLELRARSAGAWKVEAAADPTAFVRQVETGVEEWATRAAEQQRFRAQQTELEPERARLDEKRVSLEAARSAAELAYEAAEKRVVELSAARAALLEGSADVEERRSRDALRGAKEAAERALAHGENALRDEVRTREHRERAGDAVTKAAAAATDATRALDAALADHDLDRERALSLLRVAQADLDSWRASIDRLDRERAEADAVHAERTRKREAREQTDAPATDAEASRALVTDAATRLRGTRELLHSVRARLEQDDEHRVRSDALCAELDRMREQLGVWEVLADLIGSASGNKLRVFAQSLTLELLLEHANHHLRELARRYALQRVPGESLALQIIDHEMGDEVRSVSSLSGGESFLVALGMALGLASLSSQQARVDSLFIDEGFGSLDPSSLEQVLGTLDELHSTGRQIGLISHVPSVAERFDTRVQVVPAGPARSRVALLTRPV